VFISSKFGDLRITTLYSLEYALIYLVGRLLDEKEFSNLGSVVIELDS
jgi:hypothetical protein